MEHLRGLCAVTPVAVNMDGAGGGGVVDEEDAGHHVLGPHGAGDRVMGDEVLHILLKLSEDIQTFVSKVYNNAAVTVLMIKIDD